MSEIFERKTITRRRFVAIGALSCASAGLFLSGCMQKNNNPDSKNMDKEITGISAAISEVADNFNPVGQMNPATLSANCHVLEGLYEMDFMTFKIYNGLAGMTPNKITDTVYDVVLRDQAKFSNGAAVEPADVVNAFTQNMIAPEYSVLLSFIKSVDVVDTKTVRFTLKYNMDPVLKERLALVKVYPRAMSAAELNSSPLGSGPWMYSVINKSESAVNANGSGDSNRSSDKKNAGGGQIKFTPNPYYNNRYKPVSPSMDWHMIADDAKKNEALTSGSVCVADSFMGNCTEDMKKTGYTVDYVQSCSCPFLMFNTLKAPFNNYKVRQAFLYAIDTQNLINAKMDGHATEATSILPKFHSSYHKPKTTYEYNVDKAKQLLSEAGVSSLSCTMIVNNTWSKCLAEDIRSNLEEAGMKCEVKAQEIDWTQFFGGQGSSASAQKQGDSAQDGTSFDIVLSSVNPSNFGMDTDTLISWWYGDTPWMQKGTSWKVSDYSKWNELNKLLQSARETAESKKQMYWNECQEQIAQQVPIFPLFFRDMPTIYNTKKLMNFKASGASGLFFPEAYEVQ